MGIPVDMGGDTLRVQDLVVGVTKPGDYNSGSAISSAELAVLDGVTAGTVTASKAVVVDASKNVATFGTVGSGAITSTGASSFGSISSVGAVTSTAIVRGTRFISAEGAPTSSNNAGANTITAAQLLTGIYVRDPNGAGRTDTFDTAANIVAAVTGAAVGDVIRLLIVNGADAAETITLAAGSGGGFDANQTAAARVIPQNTSKVVHIRLTNVTPSSEAYVIYA